MTNSRKKKLRPLWELAPVVATLTLLGGALADKVMFHLPPADAAPYHARVSAMAAGVPYTLGPWLGTDTPVPPSAVALLHPNVILSRQYQDVRTGRTAGLLIVQCQDARELIGHYPPACYVAHGWLMRGRTPKTREVDGEIIPITDYAFTSQRVDETTELRIDNFMVLPDGQTCPDMDAVEAMAQDYRRKFFGAAQVQVISDARCSESEREEMFRQLVRAAGPLLREMRSGVTR